MDSLKSAVSGTRSGFDIQNDLNLLDSIGSNIQELDTLRQTDLDARKARIEDLNKQLNSLDSSIKRLRGSDKFKRAKTELMDLENRLFKIAGNLTTFNMELNSLKLTYNQDLKRLDELEDELTGLKNSFGLESSDDAVERAKIIKLKLYESTGLKLDPERREVLVLNKSANKTTVLKVNDNYSDYFISNYIWANI